MKIGDRVRLIPAITKDKDGNNRSVAAPLPGTVTYIHPKRRFYVVLFDDGFRESFPSREVEKNGQA